MAQDNNTRSFGNGIVSLEMELTSGTWYTLWAPNWIVRGESWQAFLGDDEHVFVFDSPAKLLGFLNDGGRNDLTQHTKWNDFSRNLASNVAATKHVSLVEVPHHLAQRPGYGSTLKVTQGFDLLASFGNVLAINSINNWFHSYSILHNTRRGADHYASTNGVEEWTAVGRTVIDRWKDMHAEVLDYLKEPEVSADAVAQAQRQLDDVQAEKKAKAAAAEEKKNKEQAAAADKQVDPYDSTLWAEAGIDPIRISLNGQYVYTLRTYVNNKPLFLGHNGEINTFPNSKALVRWIIDAPQHDLEELSTWPDIVSAANSGELEVKVHESNQYAFTGLRADIAKNVDAVDTDQLSRAYELLADAADWAKDDGVNKILLAYPRLQDYLSYMLGSPTSATPSAPFDEESKGWQALEEGLIRRFTKF